jgi:hypothetical protein
LMGQRRMFDEGVQSMATMRAEAGRIVADAGRVAL